MPQSRSRRKSPNLGHTAADKIDVNRDAAAGGIEKAASALHEKADSLPGGKRSPVSHTLPPTS